MSKRGSNDMEIEEGEEEIQTGARMEIETPNVEVQRFIRVPRNYRRMMAIYQNAQPGTVSSRVCNSKTGLEGDNVCLAREDSTPDNVICPDGYHPSFKWPFCCVKDGVSENLRGVVVNATSQGMDESSTKRIRRVEFGRLYRRLRPHATKEFVDKKYRAYLRVLKKFRAD
jgi:hypothetical protein